MAWPTAIRLATMTALLDDGRSVPITELRDGKGEVTSDLDEAVAFVCGAGNEWFSDRLADYQREALH